MVGANDDNFSLTPPANGCLVANPPCSKNQRADSRKRFIRSLGGGLAGQFLAKFLRHLEDEGFSFAVLLKEPQVDEI